MSEARAGRVAIIGRPNVGKSTLINAILGQKLAIITPTPGTTRSCMLGVYASDEPPTQIAFIDTPGLERPRNVLGRVLVEEAQGSFDDADAVLLLIDATHRGPGGALIVPEDEQVLEQIEAAGKPVVLALNKVDKVPDKGALLPRLAAWDERHELSALVPISALKGKNIAPLIAELRELMPQGVLYDADFLTDRPTRFFAAELVREAIIKQTRQEVPHCVAVQVEEFSEDPELTRISATIHVDRSSHKGILIGARGSRLKEIGTAARLEIEALLQRKVFLKLWVKVDNDWTRDPNRVRELTKDQLTQDQE